MTIFVGKEKDETDEISPVLALYASFSDKLLFIKGKVKKSNGKVKESKGKDKEEIRKR